MAKPKGCPKCKAPDDSILPAEEMNEGLGLNLPNIKKWLCDKCSYFFDDDEAELDVWYDGADFSKMKLSRIADVIIDDWEDDISPEAWPYVEAMMNLNDMHDNYGQDSAENVVAYFLSNAKKWQGPVAQRVKKYLRGLVGEK